MRNKLMLIVGSVLCLATIANGASKLREVFNWRELDFQFPSPQMKQQALASGQYKPKNALPVGIEHWGNKLFVSVPRWMDGIPATLTYIDLSRTPSGSPELIPYPDWTSNMPENCPIGLNTVYRIKADKCGRLWVLDVGTIGIGNTTRNVCPYALNVFDLRTNTKIRRYEFRPEDTNANTFIANIAIDIGASCDDTYAYMSDELGYGLIVYSWMENKSWRFEHSYFFPDPLRGDFNIGGLNFQWGEEGIFGLALSPIGADGYRNLYFSPLASHREFKVSTRVLRFEANAETSYHDFQFLEERGPNSHTTSRVMDDTGLMLYNLIDQNSVGCWHESMPYGPQFHDVVDRDDNGLIFPADVKIDENRDVWVISDRMPIFLITQLDYSDINFRIYTAPLDDLVSGTICDVKSGGLGNRFGGIDTTKTTLPSTIPTIPTYSTNSFHGHHGFGNNHHFYHHKLSPGYNFDKFHKVYPTSAYFGSSEETPLYTTKSQSPSPTIYTTFTKNSFESLEDDHSLVPVTFASKKPVPKAFVFNSHNGVKLETQGESGGTLDFGPYQGGPSQSTYTNHGSWWSRRGGIY